MWKYVLAGVAALAIGGSTLVYAQQQRGDFGPRWSFNSDDRGAFIDARIAAVKAGLRLTPEQEKNWPAVEAAVRDLIKLREDQRATRRERFDERDPVARMRSGADSLAAMADGIKRVADAADPLYKSLDDAQKRRLALLGRAGMRDRFMARMWRGDDRRDGWRNNDRREGWRERRMDDRDHRRDDGPHRL